MQTFIAPELAPAIGPYCHAVRTGDLLFISGQVPVNGAGEIVGSSMAEQTEQTMKNLKSVLGRCGLEWKDIVKTTVYVSDITAFSEMNAVYAGHFGDHRPARACVEVSRLAKDMLIEIEAVAEFSRSK